MKNRENHSSGIYIYVAQKTPKNLLVELAISYHYQVYCQKNKLKKKS